MKPVTRIIRILTDFDYGKAKGLGYISFIIWFATFIEVTKIDRKWNFIIVPLAFVLTWLWGVFLRKIKFRKRETDFITDENEKLKEIFKKIK